MALTKTKTKTKTLLVVLVVVAAGGAVPARENPPTDQTGRSDYAPSYSAPSYSAPSYEGPAYEGPAYEEHSYGVQEYGGGYGGHHGGGLSAGFGGLDGGYSCKHYDVLGLASGTAALGALALYLWISSMTATSTSTTNDGGGSGIISILGIGRELDDNGLARFLTSNTVHLACRAMETSLAQSLAPTAEGRSLFGGRAFGLAQPQCFEGIVGALAGFAALGGLLAYALAQATTAAVTAAAALAAATTTTTTTTTTTAGGTTTTGGGTTTTGGGTTTTGGGTTTTTGGTTGGTTTGGTTGGTTTGGTTTGGTTGGTTTGGTTGGTTTGTAGRRRRDTAEGGWLPELFSMDPTVLQLLATMSHVLTDDDLDCSRLRLCEAGNLARQAGHPYTMVVPFASLPMSWFISRGQSSRMPELCWTAAAMADGQPKDCRRLYPKCRR